MTAVPRQPTRQPRPFSSVVAGFIRYRTPILVWLVSRLVLLGFQALVIAQGGSAANAPWWHAWLRWDAQFYHAIARDGYTYTPEAHSSIVFFPLYPAVTRLVAALTGTDAALLIVSNLALLGALIYLYRLTEREGLSEVARTRALLYLVALPVGFFLGAGYAESLFLLLTLACADHARRGQWRIALVLAMLATLTRVTGVLMVGVVALEWMAAHGFTLRQWRDRGAWRALWAGLRADGWVVLAALGVPLALASFMLYLHVMFGSPLLFIEGHSLTRGAFGLDRAWNDWLKVITFTTPRPDLMLGAVMLVFLPVATLRAFRVRAGHGFYLLLSALIPLTTGLISYMRLMGGVYPLYLGLATQTENPRIHLLLLTLFLLLQTVVSFVFFNGGVRQLGATSSPRPPIATSSPQPPSP